ncbi:hypothetical protein Tco_1190896, partial [Tanacetum coccineum]
LSVFPVLVICALVKDKESVLEWKYVVQPSAYYLNFLMTIVQCVVVTRVLYARGGEHMVKNIVEGEFYTKDGSMVVLSMDLFSFIHHVDPTKVGVAEMEKAGDQVPLLKATGGRNGAEKEHSTGGGEYVALTEAIVEPVNEDVAEKPRRIMATTSGASANTGRKSRAAIQSLLDSSKLDAEIKVTVAATVPLVTSFVTPTPERKGGDHTDYVFGPNLHTKPASVRFVISLDSSHYSSTHVVDVEVSFLVKSTVLDPPVMTAAVTTTAVVETSLVLVSKVTVKPVNPIPITFFWGFEPSDPVPGICSQVNYYQRYDQLYAEFNVGAARQTCLGAEVRMRAEHTLRKKKILEEECARQTNLLKEKDAEVASLKS